MLLPVQNILLFGRSSGLFTHSMRVYRACLLATRPHTLKQKTSFCNRVDFERRGMWLSLYVQMASVACGCKSFFSSPSKCSSLLSDHRLTMRLATLTPSHYSFLLSQSLDEASCFVLPTRQSSQMNPTVSHPHKHTSRTPLRTALPHTDCPFGHTKPSALHPLCCESRNAHPPPAQRECRQVSCCVGALHRGHQKRLPTRVAKQQDDSPLSSHLLPPLCLHHVGNAGGCLGHACEWYTQWTTPPANMTATNCDSMYRTMGVNCSNGQGASLCLVVVVVVVVVHEK